MSSGPGRLTSLSVVVPCFNEEGAIGSVVTNVLAVARPLVRELEVIVVDDGSTDGTSAIVRDLASAHPEVRLVAHGANRGYGAALRSGFAASRNGHVFFTDGDGQFDLSDLPALLALLARYDVVSGYRAVRSDPLVRRWNGVLWTLLTNAMLGGAVRDVNCAFKVVPRGLLEKADLRSEGALISAELLAEARRLGFSIGQIGVRHLARTSGRPTGAEPTVIARALVELLDLVGRRIAAPAAVASRG